MEIVLGILLLVAAVFLVVAVLMQDGKDHRLSGAIAGGSDTFFGKNQGATKDKILAKTTSIVAVVFCLIVVAMYIFQPTTDYSGIIGTSTSDTDSTVDISGDDVSDDVSDDTDVDASEDEGADSDASEETDAE